MEQSFEEAAREISQSYIRKARACLDKGNMEGAKLYLGSARNTADDSQQGEVQALESDFRQKRRAAIQDLEAQIQEGLEADPYVEGAVQTLIDQLEELAPEKEMIAVWRQEARERGILWDRAQQVEERRAEVDSLLARAEDARQKGAYQETVVELYKQAEHVATAAAATYPGAFVGLPERAARERNQYEAECTLFSTVGLAGHYRQALHNIDQMDPSKNVPVFDLEGLQTDLLPVPEARKRYQLEAYNWVMDKTPEKIEEARQALADTHSPDTALKVLTDFQLLVAGLMPDPERMAIEEVIAKEIEPAQEQRAKAETLLSEAAAQGMDQIAKAWDRMKKALKLDPHAPSLESVRGTLRERLRAHVRRLLGEAESFLQDRQLEEAEKRAQQALKEASLDDTPALLALQTEAGGVLARIRTADAQEKRVADTIKQIRVLLGRKEKPLEAGQQARLLWQELKAQLGADAARYPEIDAEGARLAEFLDIGQFTDSVEGLLQGEEAAGLEQALAKLDAVRKNYPDRSEELDRWERRIRARQAVLQAQRELEVETGSLKQAEDLFQAATGGDARPEDRLIAQGELERIREGKARDEEAKRDLQRAEAVVKGRPEEAYRILLRWRTDRYLPSRERVARAWHQMAVAWRPRMEKELESLLQVSDGELNIRRIRHLVEEVLPNLDDPQADLWRRRALPRVCRRLALGYEETGNWPAAVHWWTQAKESASEDEQPAYHERVRAAQLQADLHKLDLAVPSESNRTKLLALESQHPRSVEVKRHLAELYLARGQREWRLDRRADAAAALGQAKIEAEGGLGLPADAGKDEEGSRQALQAVMVMAERLEKVSRRQDELEALLEPRQGVEHFARAPVEAEALMAEFPDLKDDLKVWWIEKKAQAVGRLETEMGREGRDASPGAILDQIEIASKIRCLDPGHPGAEAKIRQLDTTLVDLEDQVDQLQRNANGQGFSQDPAQALREHLTRATLLRDQARKARLVLESFGSYIGDRRPERVSNVIKAIESTVTSLAKFQAEYTRARAGLAMAKASGNWSSVDSALQEIRDLGYDQHVSAASIHQDVKAAQERRRALDELASRIREDWNSDRFPAVLAGLEQMADPDAGDPRGDYGIGVQLTLTDGEGRKLAQGLQQCMTLVQARQQQVDTMENWLGGLASWVNWTKVRQEARFWIDRAQFDVALQRCQEALGSQEEAEGWLQNVGGRPPAENVPLRWALAYLKQPPIPPEQLRSHRAQSVQTAAEDQRKQIETIISEVEGLMTAAHQQQAEWNVAYEELDTADRRVQQLTRGGLPLLGTIQRWRRRDDIVQAKEDLAAVLDRCHRLCRDHPQVVQLRKRSDI